MGRVEGKVAFITGAARGQGRSHALLLAEEGADIIALDICRRIESMPYDAATSEDLSETAEAVEALGRRIVTIEADVRDEAGVAEAVARGVAEVGPIDILITNAGVGIFDANEGPTAWQDTIDVNLTGVFNTIEAVIPSMIERNQGGSVIITSSTAGLRGSFYSSRGGLAYVASKHGVVGLMRAYANRLAKSSIRVNSVHPGGVDTPMVNGPSMLAYVEKHPEIMDSVTNALPVEILSPRDISNAVLYLASDESRFVTGTTMSVDAGFVNKV